jgi:predicted nuclease of restriction endonuclease-like (RecB) superfamily
MKLAHSAWKKHKQKKLILIQMHERTLKLKENKKNKRLSPFLQMKREKEVLKKRVEIKKISIVEQMRKDRLNKRRQRGY